MGLSESDLRLGARLGKGAAAEIFEVRSIHGDEYAYPVVFKRYFRPSEVSAPGLDSLHQFRGRLAPSTQKLLDSRTAWPLATVASPAGAFVGYLMPQLPEDGFVTVHTATGKDFLPCEIQFLFNDDRTIAQLLHAKVPLGYRVAIALDLARTYALFDKYGLVYGDLSWKNLVWTSFSVDPHIVLVDCDAIRMRGMASAAPQMHSPGWIPPEATAGPHPQTVESDRYKLGLAVLRILTPGLHSQVRSPDPARDAVNLGTTGAGLLGRALSASPDDRPTAREWVDALVALSQQRPFDIMTAVEPPRVGTVSPRPAKVVRPPMPIPPRPAGRPRAKKYRKGQTRPNPGRVQVHPSWNQNVRPPAPQAFGSPSVYPAPGPRRPYPAPVQGRSTGGFPKLDGVTVVAIAMAMFLLLIGPISRFLDSPGMSSSSSFDPVDAVDTVVETTSTTTVSESGFRGGQLTAGQTLPPDGTLRGSDGSSVTMQSDGDLVLRNGSGNLTGSTKTGGFGPSTATMQADGNLVVRKVGEGVTWSSGTQGHPGAKLVMDINGGMYIVSDADGVIWDSVRGLS